MTERTRHRRAFDLYVRLGGRRSLDGLHSALREDPGQIGLDRAPTRRAIEAWSAAFHWQERVRDLEGQAAEQDRRPTEDTARDERPPRPRGSRVTAEGRRAPPYVASGRPQRLRCRACPGRGRASRTTGAWRADGTDQTGGNTIAWTS